MKQRGLWILIGVAMLALAGAWWISHKRQPLQEDATAALPLIPGLEAGLNEVEQVRITTAGNVLQATLLRQDSGWSLEQRAGWPVDVGKLRDVLLKLARAKRVESKTDNPALYYKLGVEDIATADTPGVLLELEGLAQPVKLVIGRNVTRGSGTFVRHADEAQSWLADADLALDTSAANWLERDLLDIASGRIASVEVTPLAGPKIEIVAAEAGANGDFVLRNPPRGREPASDFVADATAGFLAALRFDDLVSGEAATAPESGTTRAQFRTKEGVTVDVVHWSVDDRQLVQLSARLDEALATAFVEKASSQAAGEHAAIVAAAVTEPGADEAPSTPAPELPASPLAVSDPAADKAARLEALRGEVAALGVRTQGRAFVLPAFKTSNLVRSLEEYLKPRE